LDKNVCILTCIYIFVYIHHIQAYSYTYTNNGQKHANVPRHHTQRAVEGDWFGADDHADSPWHP